MSWVKVGAKCVCIVDAFYNIVTNEIEEGPPLKRVLTVEAFFHRGSKTFVAIWGQPLDAYFDSAAFRPVVPTSRSLEHDVAKFKKIAGHVPAPETERA